MYGIFSYFCAINKDLMFRSAIKKTIAFFFSITHNKPRPGLIGNISFLLLAFGMVIFIAHSEYVMEYPAHEPLEVEEVSTRAFTDEDLLFYQDTITKLLLSQHFNGSVLLAREGEVLFSHSFGFADFRNDAPLTTKTPFQLASISKTFTATATLMLHDRGKLHLDDPVAKHIPEFQYPDITIRHLLSHTSGLHNYMYLLERYWDEARPPTNEDVLDLFTEYPMYLNFRPGTRFDYSNTGYAFLGLLIERVSGKTFASFMHEEIFDPLGMKHTFVYDPGLPEGTPKERAFGFRRWGNTHIIIPDVVHDGVMGDKGIYSDIHDLYRWDRAIAEGSLLSDSLWHTAFKHTRLVNNRTVRYGMGWRLQSYMGKAVAHHPGRWNGFRTSLKRFVDDDATLILLSNNNRNITHLVEALQNILFYQEIATKTQPPEKEDPRDYDVIGGGSGSTEVL